LSFRDEVRSWALDQELMRRMHLTMLKIRRFEARAVELFMAQAMAV